MFVILCLVPERYATLFVFVLICNTNRFINLLNLSLAKDHKIFFFNFSSLFSFEYLIFDSNYFHIRKSETNKKKTKVCLGSVQIFLKKIHYFKIILVLSSLVSILILKFFFCSRMKTFFFWFLKFPSSSPSL